MARPLEFPDLIAALREEHRSVERRLDELEGALAKRRYAEATRMVPVLCDDLRQHIIDEEARVLKVLIDAHGVKGAEEAITTFREHRTIHDLIGELEKVAVGTPGAIGPRLARLRGILSDHMLAEEKRIFPWALDTYAGSTKAE